MRKLYLCTAMAVACTLTACGGSSSSGSSNSTGSGSGPTPEAKVYAFNSFLPGEDGNSSVSYGGQTSRHILIQDLKTYMGQTPSQTVADNLLLDVLQNYIYRNDSADLNMATRDKTPSPNEGAQIRFSVGGGLATKQTNYAADKNLVKKLAGQDKPEHLANAFVGWDAASVTNASAADKPLAALFDMLTQYSVAAVKNSAYTIPLPGGASSTVSEPYLNDKGIDFQQLVQKFLLMAVTFSQGTADYLKTDFSASGANNAPDKTGKPYTKAEHKWDEAFGYLGAARNMPAFTDLEARAKSGRSEYQYGYFDADGDGKVDLGAELNLGQAVNCAKRDIGASAQQTDYTAQIFDAFYNGRKLINDAASDLSAAQVTELNGYATDAALVWEKCIAATVVHYINDTLDDLDYTDADGYKTLAKHWSEMKGFALGLQFNPDSPLSNANFITIHDKMGMAPVLADANQADRDAYKTALREAKALLIAAYDAEFQANADVW